MHVVKPAFWTHICCCHLALGLWFSARVDAALWVVHKSTAGIVPTGDIRFEDINNKRALTNVVSLSSSALYGHCWWCLAIKFSGFLEGKTRKQFLIFTRTSQVAISYVLNFMPTPASSTPIYLLSYIASKNSPNILSPSYDVGFTGDEVWVIVYRLTTKVIITVHRLWRYESIFKRWAFPTHHLSHMWWYLRHC